MPRYWLSRTWQAEKISWFDAATLVEADAQAAAYDQTWEGWRQATGRFKPPELQGWEWLPTDVITIETSLGTPGWKICLNGVAQHYFARTTLADALTFAAELRRGIPCEAMFAPFFIH